MKLPLDLYLNDGSDFEMAIPIPTVTAISTAPRLDNGHFVAQGRDSPRPGYKRFPEASLQSVYGLVQLPHRVASLSWANA